MKEDKIKILFKQLQLTEEEQEKFSSLKLEKVKVNEKAGSWIFVLRSDKVLDLEDYKFLTSKSEVAFRDIKKVIISILPNEKDNTLL